MPLSLVLLAALPLACSSGSPESNEPTPTLPETKAPESNEAPEAQEPAEPATKKAERLPVRGSCAECPAPAECRTVVGMMKGSARKECWVPCQETEASRAAKGRATELKSCPDGMHCTFIHDGAGQVCVYPEADDEES